MRETITADELLARLEAWVERAGQLSVASKCGVSQPRISQMINGQTAIGPSVFLTMGYRRVTTFERIATPHINPPEAS